MESPLLRPPVQRALCSAVSTRRDARRRRVATMAAWSGKCCSPRPAATAPGSSARSRRSRRRSSSTAPPVYVRKQIVHNLHVVRDLEARARSSSTRRPRCREGETVVFSAHGVAPSVHANAAARRLNTIDATCPLVTKVHVQARRYAADGYTVLLIGHEGHEEVVGTMGEAPDSIVLVESVDDAERLEFPAGDAPRVRDADDALGRRDRRDHHRAAPALPRHPRAEEGRHLLRDLESPVGGEGDARRDRPAARDRLAQLVELEPARRGRARRTASPRT